jgi:hypothetical protein
VTFVGGAVDRDVPPLKLGTSSLTGTGADVEFSTEVDGNQLGGTFTLAYDGSVSQPIDFDASSSQLKSKLEYGLGIHTVTVVRSAAIDAQLGRSWTITFTSDSNKGPLSDLVASNAGLTGTGNTITVCSNGNTGGLCSTASGTTRGNTLGGLYRVDAGGSDVVYIQHDASDMDVKTELEKLGLGTVAITRSAEDRNGGFTWEIQYETEKGDVADLQISSSVTTVSATQGQADVTYTAPADLTSVVEVGSLVEIDGSEYTVQGHVAGTITLAAAITSVDGNYALETLTGVGSDVVFEETRKGTDQEQQRITVPVDTNFTITHAHRGVTLTTDTITCVDEGLSEVDAADSVKDALERLSNVGVVTITSTISAGVSYTFDITFDTAAGDIQEVTAVTVPGGSSLTTSTLRTGNSVALGGLFTVSFRGQRSIYLPAGDAALTANAMRTALETLTTIGTVEVSRSDVDENLGYTWSVTFMTEFDDPPLMVMDSRALTGTAAEAKVAEYKKGVPPPFSAPDGTDGQAFQYDLTDLVGLQHNIGSVKADLFTGVPYYVRAAAINSDGRGPWSFSTPRFLAPLSQPPSPPNAVSLEVVDGYSIKVGFAQPSLVGGRPVDKYKVEWDTEAFVTEVQAVRVACDTQAEIQTITTAASDVDEIQVVRTDCSTCDGTTVTEIQGIECRANSGTFRLQFRGVKSAPVSWDATAQELETALNSISTLSSVSVSIGSAQSTPQTTICREMIGSEPPQLVSVAFDSVPGLAGDMPMLVADVTSLGGSKVSLLFCHLPSPDAQCSLFLIF